MLAEKRQAIVRETRKRGKKRRLRKRERRTGLYTTVQREKEKRRERVGISIRKPATAGENASRYYSRTSKVSSPFILGSFTFRFLPHLSLSLCLCLFFSRAREMRFASPFSGFFTTREIFTLCVAEYLGAFRGCEKEATMLIGRH